MIFFQILALAASLEFGALQGSSFNYNDRNPDFYQFHDIALYTTLKADATYRGFYIGGGMENYFTPESFTNYIPFQMDFTFEAGYRSGPVKIGFEHTCYHPMQPYATIIGNEIKPKYEGGYNKLFIRISTF